MLLIKRHLNLRKIAKSTYTTSNFCKQKGFELLVSVAFETILALDEGNGFGKSNNKSYVQLRVPENEINF